MKNGEEIIEEIDELLEHATEFYKNLIGPYTRLNYQIICRSWSTDEKLRDEKNEILTVEWNRENTSSLIREG